MLGFTALALALPATPARAQSWVFQRSYYSHVPTTGVPIGDQGGRRGPVFVRPMGAYITVGARFLNSRITVGGQNYDHLRIYESWIQDGGNF